MKKLPLLIGVIAAVGFAGCRSIEGPDLFAPGSVRAQQFEAHLYDPYPENDAAPEIEGGRPQAFDKGVPEVYRARPFARPPSW